MPLKNKRRDAKRDENEPEIVKGLQDEGYYVERIDEPGDLVVWCYDRERWFVFEVKVQGGRFTPRQKKFRAENPKVPVPVIHDVDEALAILRD